MSRRGPRQAGDDRRARWRVALLAVAVLAPLVAAAGRAVHLQVFRAEDLRRRADDQRVRQVELLPERGTIYDRHQRLLAHGVPGASVFVDPSSFADAPADLVALCRALDLPVADARKQLARGGARFAWLKRGVSPREAEDVRALALPGVGVAREPQRYYPKKALAGPVLGFVGVDGEGLGGLEHRFDAVLKGVTRRVPAERDARGRLLLADAPNLTGGRGKSLVLTLDETIQHVAEEELQGAVERSRAKGGVVVVLDPATGEILALAQAPGFNPNAAAAAPAEHRKAKGAVDVYEPGSVLKALFLGLVLDRGLTRPAERIFCENGKWPVHGRTIGDHVPHGWLTVAEILKVSSNIGVAKLSERLSRQDFYDGLVAFGFGVATGAEIPGESRGLLAPPGTWSKISAKTISYGHGISATGLQVASAIAAVANGGVRMKPHLVRAILDEEGRVAQTFAPEVAGRPLTAPTAATLGRLMEDVVHAEGGTAGKAAVPGYRAAGKTGTSWKPNLEAGGYHRNRVVASFAGFIPAGAPRLAIVVAIDEPAFATRYGGQAAAPAFREIAGRVLAYLQVPAEAPVEATVARAPVAAPAPPEEAPVRPARAEGLPVEGVAPDLTGLTMREALRRLDATGADGPVSLLGSGVAVAQDPPPGAPLEPGQEFRVVFKPIL